MCGSGAFRQAYNIFVNSKQIQTLDFIGVYLDEIFAFRLGN